MQKSLASYEDVPRKRPKGPSLAVETDEAGIGLAAASAGLSFLAHPPSAREINSILHRRYDAPRTHRPVRGFHQTLVPYKVV